LSAPVIVAWRGSETDEDKVPEEQKNILGFVRDYQELPGGWEMDEAVDPK